MVNDVSKSYLKSSGTGVRDNQTLTRVAKRYQNLLCPVMWVCKRYQKLYIDPSSTKCIYHCVFSSRGARGANRSRELEHALNSHPQTQRIQRGTRN